MDALFWWVGCIVVTLTALCILFLVAAVGWSWLSTAHVIWKGYVNVHEAHPELEIISQDFRDKYGKHWKLVLFGALASQYQWLMKQNCRTYETEWFSVDLRALHPEINYHVKG